MIDGSRICLPADVVETPWDKRSLGVDTYELKRVTAAALEFSDRCKGHFTVKVNPLSDTEGLGRHAFYYCDTLIEPFVSQEKFKPYSDPRVTVEAIDFDSLKPLCRGVFDFGRFHRDPFVDNALADLRYENWLADLWQDGQVFGLFFQGELAAFFACRHGRILLHAVAEKYRGMGLGKGLWTAGCTYLFEQGYDELSSSVSAANLAIVNLYASIGFRFRHPVDVYHRYNP